MTIYIYIYIHNSTYFSVFTKVFTTFKLPTCQESDSIPHLIQPELNLGIDFITLCGFGRSVWTSAQQWFNCWDSKLDYAGLIWVKLFAVSVYVKQGMKDMQKAIQAIPMSFHFQSLLLPLSLIRVFSVPISTSRCCCELSIELPAAGSSHVLRLTFWPGPYGPRVNLCVWARGSRSERGIERVHESMFACTCL